MSRCDEHRDFLPMKKLIFILLVLASCANPDQCKVCITEIFSIRGEKFAVTSDGDTIQYIQGGTNYVYVNQVSTSHETDSISFLLFEGYGEDDEFDLYVNDSLHGHYSFDGQRDIPIMLFKGYSDINILKLQSTGANEVFIGKITLNSLDIARSWNCTKYENITFLGEAKFIVTASGSINFKKP